MNEFKNELNTLLQNGMTQEDAFAFYDKLEPVENAIMIGKWKGKEAPSFHPMDGVLTVCPWHGKEFVDQETVHPLVFDKKNGKSFYFNPDNIFKHFESIIKSKTLKKMINSDKPIDPHKYDCLYKWFKTKDSKARLRQVEYRGKVSAAMVYDRVAIIDIFRKLDDDSVFGVMDVKGDINNLGYFFVLERESNRRNGK